MEEKLFIEKRFLQLHYRDQKEEFAKEKKIVHGTSEYFFSPENINQQHAQLSRAGRVRNGIRNPFEYNKDGEVACKLANVKDRSDIFNLLQEIQFGATHFEGIVLRSGHLVDFTLKNKSYALKLAKLLKVNYKVQKVTAYAESNVDVRIAHIFPRFPETPLTDYIQLNHGQIIKTFRRKHSYNLEIGIYGDMFLPLC